MTLIFQNRFSANPAKFKILSGWLLQGWRSVQKGLIMANNAQHSQYSCSFCWEFVSVKKKKKITVIFPLQCWTNGVDNITINNIFLKNKTLMKTVRDTYLTLIPWYFTSKPSLVPTLLHFKCFGGLKISAERSNNDLF